MTATPSIELPAWMAEQLSQASPDLLRQMVQIFAEALRPDKLLTRSRNSGHRVSPRATPRCFLAVTAPVRL